MATIAVAALSLAAIAWFALGIRQAHDTAAAGAIIDSSSLPTAAQARHAASLLRAAKALNPDTEVDVLRAELFLEQRNRPAARSLLERVVAAEPDNAVAWEWLARASVGDLREFYVAAFQFNELAPPIRSKR